MGFFVDVHKIKSAFCAQCASIEWHPFPIIMAQTPTDERKHEMEFDFDLWLCRMPVWIVVAFSAISLHSFPCRRK